MLEASLFGAPESNATTAASLFGTLLGVAVPVPASLRKDPEVLKALKRTRDDGHWGRCPMDTWYSTHTINTHWGIGPHGSWTGAIPSCAISIKLRRKLLRALLLPRLQRRRICAAEGRRSELLTIHLRGGDAVPAKTPDHAQPPCATYDHAIKAGSFKQVRVVAEDARNPCLAHLLARHPDTVREVRVGGSLTEDLCLLLSATSLFLAASTLTSSIVLLGRAERIFTPLPSEDFVPGLAFFGFASDLYLEQLCEIYKEVVAYQPGWGYYMGDVPRSMHGGHFFGHLPPTRTLEFPMEQIRVRGCPRKEVS
eukprot:gnl/TRDRNA2_/TRDRNA2_141481_c0_seq1.p1 gnl/TRDRNA2_/TRDRNA2_141481_c0~~gnl/TRDRNA2_/TRDRNA2_141481_c0_seq1.p1  ORF type:complete len:346 (+),score=41.90 gnl/TRDRNA2_/TRDRNA2_141481_c0_seq1:110-1039(+)